MKTNELRIGNLVEKNNEMFEVDFITIRMAHNYNPILLTEERLLNFGFEKIISVWYGIGNFRINTSFDIEWGGKWMGIRLKYVHQLQNLYFALTGKELEL